MIRSFIFWLAYIIGLDPRGLFVYFDGRRWKFGDPIVLARRLWSIPGFDSDESRRLIDSDAGSVKLQGFAEIADAVRKVFDVKVVDTGGLTDLECEQLLSRFEAYLGALKKNGNPGPTSSHFMVPTPPQDGITNVVSECGSTSIDNILGSLG